MQFVKFMISSALCTHVCDLSKPDLFSVPLKVVSATFLLVSFVCLKESTCETREMFFISI